MFLLCFRVKFALSLMLRSLFMCRISGRLMPLKWRRVAQPKAEPTRYILKDFCEMIHSPANCSFCFPELAFLAMHLSAH